MSAERGYTRAMDSDPEYPTGCICGEDFEHDGKCPNKLRNKKSTKCPPCSQGWHHPGPCTEYVTKGSAILSTQCERCGWDSGDHPVSERRAAMIIDSRTRGRR